MRYFAPLLLLLFAAPAIADEYPARVVGITDGDTLTVLTAEKKQVKIRLHGIDAPESGQDFGQKAKETASELAFGKDVRILPRSTDRYGRTVAEVILPDGDNLNLVLVERGMAWHRPEYAPNDISFIRRQVCAKKVELGIWSQPNPIPPWKWRKGEGQPVTAGVMASRRGKVYHAPYCGGASRISARNYVGFATVEEAEAAGYRKARDCE